RVEVEVGPLERHVQLAERHAGATVRPAGGGVGAVEHLRDRVAHGDDEWSAHSQNAVDLAEQSRQVVDLSEGVGGDRQIDLTAGGPSEVGQLALVALHLDLGGLGGGTQSSDAVGGGI